MSQAESRLSRRIQVALRAQGAFVFKVHGSATMLVGLPDLIGCYQGRFFGLEVKRPGRERHTSPAQRRVIQLIEAAGGIACVVTSPAQALAALGQP